MSSFEQWGIILLLLGLMAIFAMDRFRIELVALTGLAIGFALGLVPAADLFSGFSSPAVITVAEILLIIQALDRSKIVERIAQPMTRFVSGERSALFFLCAAAATVSAFMNNIGALALIIPVALSIGARLGIPLSRLLMPISFATLLGGICSLIGTPANLVVSQARAGAVGTPFALFDFAHVGIPVALVGIVFLVLWLPRRFGAAAAAETSAAQSGDRRVVTEVIPGEIFQGRPAGNLETEYGAKVISIIRAGKHVFSRLKHEPLQAEDILIADLSTTALRRALDTGALLSAIEGIAADTNVLEAVVMPQSIFVGSRVGTLEPLLTRGITVVGVIQQRSRAEGRLSDLQLGVGDVLLLAGVDDENADVLQESDLLQLSVRESFTVSPRSLLPIAVFGIGVLVSALDLLPPEVAFGLVVLALAAAGSLRLREGLQNMNWPILIMLAAMIPLGTAVETTGAAHTLSMALLGAVPMTEPTAVVAAVLLAAAILTPFANNVSTAVVLSPIAIDIAHTAQLPPEPLLVAVALGASLDFLTPFGHHNNTLVMGIGGYRFIDFPRLGLPLFVLTLVTGLLAISFIWL